MNIWMVTFQARSAQICQWGRFAGSLVHRTRRWTRRWSPSLLWNATGYGPFPLCLAYSFILYRNRLLVSVKCQHVMSVRLPNCISSWPFAYTIRDSGSVWGLFWGKQVAWSSWWSTSASRCALAVGGMCLSTLFVLAILVVCHDMRHLTFP